MLVNTGYMAEIQGDPLPRDVFRNFMFQEGHVNHYITFLDEKKTEGEIKWGRNLVPFLRDGNLVILGTTKLSDLKIAEKLFSKMLKKQVHLTILRIPSNGTLSMGVIKEMLEYTYDSEVGFKTNIVVDGQMTVFSYRPDGLVTFTVSTDTLFIKKMFGYAIKIHKNMIKENLRDT